MATLTELWDGEQVGLTVRGQKVLLINLDGAVYAYEDRCPHLGIALSEGNLDGSRLTCRGHRWEYDVHTGRGINPATVRLRPLPVLLEDDDVLVDVDGGA